MPRKKNLYQELEKEQEEFAAPQDPTIAAELLPEVEVEQEADVAATDDTVLVTQTYLTEDTLPEEYKQQQETVSRAESEEENYEEEVEETEGEEYAEEGDETEDEVEEEEYEVEGEGDLEEEGEYEYEEVGNEPSQSKIGEIVNRVLASIKDEDGNLDKAALAKYAGLAVLGAYGLSRNSFVGKILISGAVSLLAKRLIDSKTAKQEEQVEEEEAVAA